MKDDPVTNSNSDYTSNNPWNVSNVSEFLKMLYCCPECEFNSIEQELFRWSTCALVYFSWLLDHMIYLKLRKE